MKSSIILFLSVVPSNLLIFQRVLIYQIKPLLRHYVLMNARFQYLSIGFTRSISHQIIQSPSSCAKKLLDEPNNFFFPSAISGGNIFFSFSFVACKVQLLKFHDSLTSFRAYSILMAKIKFMSHNGVSTDNLFCDTCKRNHVHKCVARCRFMSC